jgi:hypothetical protein
MTPADLDEFEAMLHLIIRRASNDEVIEVREIVRLARRGLRAEREVCKMCKYWADDYCDWWDYRRCASSHCSDWRERGGGE